MNTVAVKEIVEQNEVVTLLADWTDRNAEIGELLGLLGSKQLPVVAIFPADRPNEPIVVRGWYTKAGLLEKLKEAGPSLGVAAAATQGSDALAQGR